MAEITLNKTLFIGLGGTGFKTLLKTKKLFRENYGIDGEIPPMIRFLVFDTDQTENDKRGAVESNIDFSAPEIYNMTVPAPTKFRDLHEGEISTWMPDQNKQIVRMLKDGAGQVRTNGRLAFIFHCSTIKEKIKQALLATSSQNLNTEKWSNYVPTGGLENSIDVNIVFSISGGTGCGLFIDMAYMVKQIANDENINVKINGYAILPGVFDKEIQQSIAKPRIFSNAYGAIFDMDYLMDMTLTQNTVNINWHKDQFETSEPPFDMFVMVDNRNSDGVVFGSMKELASMLSLSLMLSSSNLSADLASVNSNAAHGELNIENKQAWISAIGACTIVYKNENVASVYRDKVINKIIRQMLQDEDVNQEALAWMKVAKIEEHDGDDVIDAIASTAISPVILNEDSLDRKTAETRIDTALDNQKNQFIPSSEDFETAVNRKMEAVSAALDEKLKTMIDIEGRVKSADRLLDEIKNRIDRFFVPEMTQEMDNHRNAKADAETQLASGKQSLTDFLSKVHVFGGAEKTAKVRNIKSAIDQIVLEELETKRRSYAITFYAKLSELIANYKNQINTLIASLNTILDENTADIQNNQNAEEAGRKLCVINLATNETQTIEVEEFAFTFEQISVLTPNQSFLKDNLTDALRNAFTSFSDDLQPMRNIMARTIDDVLNGMSEDDFKTVINRAIDRAVPFLNVQGAPYLLGESGEQVGSQQLYGMGVPDTTTCRLTKNGDLARWMRNNQEPKAYTTGLTDRVVIYRYMWPIPAYAVTTLNAMRLRYNNEKVLCPHFDALILQRIHDECFDIQPRVAGAKEALEAWVKGCIMGRIKVEKNSYWYQDPTVQQVSNAQEGWVSAQTAYRDKTYTKFSKKTQLVKRYLDDFKEFAKSLSKKDYEELIKNVRENYFEDYSRCTLLISTIETGRGYEDTYKLILSEQALIKEDYIFKVR